MFIPLFNQAVNSSNYGAFSVNMMNKEL